MFSKIASFWGLGRREFDTQTHADCGKLPPFRAEWPHGRPQPFRNFALKIRITPSPPPRTGNLADAGKHTDARNPLNRRGLEDSREGRPVGSTVNKTPEKPAFLSRIRTLPPQPSRYSQKESASSAPSSFVMRRAARSTSSMSL